jgi:hypothetical protein
MKGDSLLPITHHNQDVNNARNHNNAMFRSIIEEWQRQNLRDEQRRQQFPDVDHGLTQKEQLEQDQNLPEFILIYNHIKLLQNGTLPCLMNQNENIHFENECLTEIKGITKLLHETKSLPISNYCKMVHFLV